MFDGRLTLRANLNLPEVVWVFPGYMVINIITVLFKCAGKVVENQQKTTFLLH